MKNLKQLREVAGQNQIDLAKKLGVTKQTLYKWERGMSPVAPAHWGKFAALLGVDTTQFQDALIETLLAYALETADLSVIIDAQKSGRYDAVKLAEAKAKIKTVHNIEPPTGADRERLLKQVVHDFSEKVADLALRRAEIHREILLERVHREIMKIFPSVTDADRDGILRDLANGTTGEGFIFAEVSKMNSTIAAIVNERRDPDQSDEAQP